MNVLSFFKVKNSYANAVIGLLVSLLIGLSAYHLYIVYGYTNADGIIEGLTAFSNATWIITGCGRWLLAILFSMAGNIVMPLPAVLGYCLCVWLTSFLITKLWKVDSAFSFALITAIMIAAPAAISHFTYNAIAFPYALAMLISCIYVYAVFQINGIISFIVCIVCISCSLGIYQSYLGFAAAMVLMTIAIKLLDGENTKTIIQTALKAIVTAILGFVSYYVILRLVYVVTGLNASSRMADFSVVKIFSSLFSDTVFTYYDYFKFYTDQILQRHVVYCLILIILFLLCISFFRKMDFSNYSLFLLCIILIPLASNIVCLAIPGTEYTTPMTYQNTLIVPFTISLNSRFLAMKRGKTNGALISALCLYLVWTYVVSANATFHSYRLSHEFTYGQMSQVVYDIEHHKDYVVNETPVIIVGFFEDDMLREKIKTYQYAIDMNKYLMDNFVFWHTPVGVTQNRYNYFLNYFGLDFKNVTYDEYLDILHTKEYQTMNSWPSDNSILKVGKYLVVKINDDILENE